MNETDRRTTLVKWAARGGFALAAIVVLLALTAGPLYAAKVYDLGLALDMLRYMFFGGAIAAGISLIALIWGVLVKAGGTRRYSVLGLVMGAAVSLFIFSLVQDARTNPVIHDATTDLDDPPMFVELEPRNYTTGNEGYDQAAQAAAYPSEEWRERHTQGFSDLDGVVLDIPPAEAIERAETVARDMGWDVVVSQPQLGHLEAVDTTFWFRFKDDIVVRARPAEGGTELDVRSVSRVGVSDLGKNASRVRAFLDQVRSP